MISFLIILVLLWTVCSDLHTLISTVAVPPTCPSTMYKGCPDWWTISVLPLIYNMHWARWRCHSKHFMHFSDDSQPPSTSVITLSFSTEFIYLTNDQNFIVKTSVHFSSFYIDIQSFSAGLPRSSAQNFTKLLLLYSTFSCNFKLLGNKFSLHDYKMPHVAFKTMAY